LATGNAKSNVKMWVSLRATIKPGWHLYALDQQPGGPMRTAIQVPAGQSYALAGDVKQPEPLTAVDPNFDMPVRYFENAVTFSVPIAVAPSPKSLKDPVTLQVSYQTCNDRLCLPLTTVKVQALVAVLRQNSVGS
jgi:thiol:disulfide interchange protein DsbD